jgi:hypothetical protein
VAIISNAVTIADAGAFSVSLGSMVHIKTVTASNAATVSFVHGTSSVVLDSTYPIYKFEFINIHGDTNDEAFTFNVSIDAGSNYNVAKTTTFFRTYHFEGDDGAALTYTAAFDLAQGTGFQDINHYLSSASDESCSGELSLYNPSSTTFVKHFMSNTSSAVEGVHNHYVAGYANTTSAVNAIQFKMDSGTFDGVIKLYGIKDS